MLIALVTCAVNVAESDSNGSSASVHCKAGNEGNIHREVYRNFDTNEDTIELSKRPSQTSGDINSCIINGRLPEWMYWCEDFDIRELIILDDVTSIGNYAFRYQHIDRVVIGDGVKTIGGRAFYESNLMSLTLSDSIEFIGREQFAGCYCLGGSSVIPDSVETIGDGVFACCEFTSIDLGNAKTIKQGVFHDCDGIESIIIITDSVETISKQAFVACDNLHTVCIRLSGAEQPGMLGSHDAEIICLDTAPADGACPAVPA